MLWRPAVVRVWALVSVAVVLAAAFTIRAVAGGGLEQFSGTALYGSAVYAMVVFLWPRLHPAVAGVIAIGFCELVEVAQLTGVPAALSQRSMLARLALGVQFDAVDLAWYPVGVVPLAALHWQLRRRRLRGSRVHSGVQIHKPHEDGEREHDADDPRAEHHQP
jgi:hypothetical protein